jgi:hypothetical protein
MWVEFCEWVDKGLRRCRSTDTWHTRCNRALYMHTYIRIQQRRESFVLCVGNRPTFTSVIHHLFRLGALKFESCRFPSLTSCIEDILRGLSKVGNTKKAMRGSIQDTFQLTSVSYTSTIEVKSLSN